jgi:hypothetical protein
LHSGIADIEPSSGDVYKMLLGSFVEEFHEDKDDGDHHGLLTLMLPAIYSSSQSATASSEFARQNIDPPPPIPSRRNVPDLGINPDIAPPKSCSQSGAFPVYNLPWEKLLGIPRTEIS